MFSLSYPHVMLLPEISERLSRFLKLDRSACLTDEVSAVSPRSLSDRELSWVQSMVGASRGWEMADLSRTRVVAEGPNSEGITYVLEAPAPENPGVNSVRSSIASLWIQTTDQLTITIQLAERQGRLQELYVLLVDTKHPRHLIRHCPLDGLSYLAK
jgi:hypothetical protein